MRRDEYIDRFIYVLVKLRLATLDDLSHRYRVMVIQKLMGEERIRMTGEATSTIEKWIYNGDK